MNMGKQEIYHPLDREHREIRVLLLKAGDRDDQLDCRLRVISLDSLISNKLRYETLSYCWGDSSLRETILLNHQSRSVPANTSAALRCIRRKECVRVVWIDAVCISQLDIEERGQQVALMAAIYQSSHGNLVYLGEDDGTSQQAFDSIRNLAEEIRDEVGERYMTRFVLALHGTWIISNTGLRCPIDEDALLKIYERTWFSYDTPVPHHDLITLY